MPNAYKEDREGVGLYLDNRWLISGSKYATFILASYNFLLWVEKGTAPAIQASLELYQEVFKLGYRIFLLTGRNNKHRDITIENLVCAGFHHWEKLIMRNPEDRFHIQSQKKKEKE
ncbi:hypothetical protein Leryth_006943 [Lithospermum erythrorhizon]|nr:hypothetical protein Leryth_006943 [Lithospermum erythrorhizon]